MSKGSKDRTADKKRYNENFDYIDKSLINKEPQKILKTKIGLAKRYIYK